MQPVHCGNGRVSSARRACLSIYNQLGHLVEKKGGMESAPRRVSMGHRPRCKAGRPRGSSWLDIGVLAGGRVRCVCPGQQGGHQAERENALRPAQDSRAVILAVMFLLISCTFLFSCTHTTKAGGVSWGGEV